MGLNTSRPLLHNLNGNISALRNFFSTTSPSSHHFPQNLGFPNHSKSQKLIPDIVIQAQKNPSSFQKSTPQVSNPSSFGYCRSYGQLWRKGSARRRGKARWNPSTRRSSTLLRNQTSHLRSHIRRFRNRKVGLLCQRRRRRLSGWCESKQEDEIELPERSKDILELFRRMSSSLRLLGLRKKLPLFQTICAQVEVMAKRKFSYKQLAQIKYILPEAVQIEKVLVHNEETQCMKPDLKVTLVFDIVEDHQEKSNFAALYQLFFSRVVDFSTSSSEDHDIPEVTLPEPFNQEKGTLSPETNPLDNSSSGPNSTSADTGLAKDFSFVSSISTQKSAETAVALTMNSATTPLKVLESRVGCSRIFDSPSVNHDLEGASVMVETPTQMIPKRAKPETDDRHMAISRQASSLSTKLAKRSLDFTHEVAERYELEKTDHVTTVQQAGPQTLRSKENSSEDKDTCLEEEEDSVNGLTVAGVALNEVGSEMCYRISPSLSGFVPLIHRIFQSVNFSSVTKQELVYKILINNLDVEERGEVEEHIEQLELLLPDWITKRISASGDYMYSIKKVPNVSTILAKLESM